MKNYLFTAVGIAITIAVAGGLTLTAGVASACMIALVSLLEVEAKRRERAYIDTDRQRVMVINKKAERLFDLECENFELTEKVKELTHLSEDYKTAFLKATESKKVTEEQSKPIAKKTTKRKTTK